MQNSLHQNDPQPVGKISRFPIAAEPDSDSKRSQIHKIAARLFAQHGYQAVGVPELCNATGLGRGAFYYHANSKDSILFDISQAFMQRMIEAAHEVVSEDMRADTDVERLSEACARMSMAEHDEMVVCFREHHLLGAANQKKMQALYAEYRAIWEATVAKGVAQGIFRPVHNIEFRGILCMHFYSFLWSETKKSTPAETISRYFSRLVLDAIRLPDTAPTALRA